MSEFVFVGSSLLEEKLMEFLNEGVNLKKVNKMTTIIMRVQEHKFDLGNKLQESGSDGKKLLLSKCEIEQKIEIPMDQVLVSERESFGVVSTSKLFENICQFLRSDDLISNYKDEFRIILISGSYFSKHLSLLIKYLPKKVDYSQIITFELFRQAYEDILSLITCIPNTMVKEAEINESSELDFKMIQKNLEKSTKISKVFNYSSISCDAKSSTYQSTRYPYQFKEIIFKINSLTLSSSSHDAIDLFMENQLTCIKIVITSKTINVIPIRQKFKDFTSILTVPSLYLFNMQNNNLLINWSPDQSCTKVNRVIYTSLLNVVIQIIGAMGIQISNAITLKSKTEINDYFHN
ncbi:uncharacterized protein ELE39_003318 [Cryptosporidium sp. chipmunk genotype I]|uniref:uncharacterized protein n=1 Tax=Cryptosporidium sp. chipmunk genotype I TaxID=1280935 RepID=UPI00351A6AE6|nr:hypothetical protein ELE39_003318 [Cryptosporidium sp. chipmunk genotype I]